MNQNCINITYLALHLGDEVIELEQDRQDTYAH